jgi:prophage regulatory protein
MPAPFPTPNQMLRMPTVMQLTGLARSTIYALIADNKFPRQVKVSENTAAWLASEIDSYLADRIAERDRATPAREGSV